MRDSLQTLRRGFQVGQEEKLRRINHEARIALNLITRLFERPHAPVVFTNDEILRYEPRNIEAAKRGAAYLLSSLNAVLDWQYAKSALNFADTARPNDYLKQLLEFAIHIAIAEVVQSADGYFTLDHAELLTPQLVNSVRVSSILKIENFQIIKGEKRSKAEHILLLTISNAVKHQILYLRTRLLEPDFLIQIPLSFWNKTLLVQLNATNNSLVVENLGPDGTAQDFYKRFAQRKEKGTYAVLNAILKDRAWARGGDIILDVRRNDESIYDTVDQDICKGSDEVKTVTADTAAVVLTVQGISRRVDD